MTVRTPAHIRILRRIGHPVEEAGCWNWTGAASKLGYGEVYVAEGVVGRTHRVVYEALVGPIPEGLHLDHLCRNPRCCNPDHLEPVTPAENVRRSRAGFLNNWQTEKTHCHKGHPFDEANTYVGLPGARTRRSCRTCHNENQRRHLARKQNGAGR